ncbi:MAG: dTDP-4-dehydrorhamnose 3,5-epimerase family protein [Rhodobacteraceae bacterium]|nr:dTDP-4-dehydrorhamnose 3,5-epimerase family protein [Paracoccaceae bacterium]
MLELDDFTDDPAWAPKHTPFSEIIIEDQIDGVAMQRLNTFSDTRGDLTVLMSNIYDPTHHSPHVYLVTAAAKSVRAWVYHRHQHDRLAFSQGDFRVVLYDLRKDSPTYGKLNVLDVGENNKLLLTIPPFVAHGVQNRGALSAQFINASTKAYDPGRPDKSRVQKDNPGISYTFE